MLKANPVIKVVSEKWNEFSNWTRETVWNPISQNVGKATQWVQEQVGVAGQWVNEKWSVLSSKAKEGWNFIQDKAGQAQEFVSGKVNSARQWVTGKAEDAWNWVDENTAGARAFVGEKVNTTKAWVGEKVDGARAFVGEKVNNAKAWVGEKVDGARAFVGEKVNNAKAWVGEKVDGAKAFVGEKVNNAKAWVGEKVDGAKAFVGEKVNNAKAWIGEKVGPAVSWLTEKGSSFMSALQEKGQAFASSVREKGGAILQWLAGAVNSVISGLEGAKNSAVSGLRGAVNSGSNWLDQKSQGAANFVEEKGNSAANWVDNQSTNVANFVEEKGNSAATVINEQSSNVSNFLADKNTAAANFVAEKGSSAANWVDNQSTNAANFVEEKGNSAATVINEQSSNAAHWIDEKGHTTSQWVKERGNQAVDLVDTAGTYAIDFLKNPQQEGQKLLHKAGEGIQAGWEWSKEQASKAANWSLEQVNWVSGKVNENIIQPATGWVQQQWNQLQGWMEAKFPGLSRCWKVFQEYSAAFAGYLKQKAEMVAKWWNESYPAISAWGHGILDVVGMVGDAVPVVGNIVAAVADILNVIWYAAEGDWTNAGLSAIAIIPYIGSLAKGGKYLGTGLKYVDDIVKLVSKYGDDVIKLFSKYGTKLGELFVKYGDDVIKVFAKYGDDAFKWLAKYGDDLIKWLAKQGDKASKFTDDALEKIFGKKAKKEAGEVGLKGSDKAANPARVEPEAPAPRNADGTADISDAKPESVPARDSSVSDSGRIESDQLSDRQIKNELDHIKDNPNLVEGTPPNRKAKVGEHEWHEQSGGGWCRHSNGKVCVRLEDIDEAVSGLRERNPHGPTAIMPPDSKNVLAGDPLPERILDTDGSLIPLGFKSVDDYKAFISELDQGLKSAGFDDVTPIFQGSSVTGFKGFDSYDRSGTLERSAGTIFDTGSNRRGSPDLSDFDIAISSPQILEKAKKLGINTRSKGTRAILDAAALDKLGLADLVESLSNRVGREVHFMVFDSIENAVSKKDSFSIIPTIR
jgi:hypothetical protein